MYGGQGFGGANQGSLSDLWTLDASASTPSWTLVGSSVPAVDVATVYGTLGTFGSSKPGGLWRASTWTIGSRMFLFGGEVNSASKSFYSSALWEMNTKGEWSWLGGRGQASPVLGSTPSTSNTPGSLTGASAGYSSNTLYLFGGELYDGSYPMNVFMCEAPTA